MATPGKAPGQAGAAYVRHRPEDTLLYQIVEENYPTFRDLLEQQGHSIRRANTDTHSIVDTPGGRLLRQTRRALEAN